ncbi:MAG: hypothetical protein EOO46_21410 [Flavobacterium sp.]|nr:MAG: hypothetical protein EOO46_21410 [Flavobacterium sp.]
MMWISFSAYKPAQKNTSEEVKNLFLKNTENFHNKCEELANVIQLLQQNQTSIQNAKKTFISTKQSYKSIEFLLEYLDPDLAKSMNGAPVPSIEVDNAEYLRLGNLEPSFALISPEGLQVIEEIIFADTIDQQELSKAIPISHSLVEKSAMFIESIGNQPLSEKQILESLREQIIRVMTMGITGFDAPAAGNEMSNTALSLQALLDVTNILKTSAKGSNLKLLDMATDQLENAINYLNKNTDFDTFDRLYFTRELANPIFKTFTLLQAAYINYPKNALVTNPINNKADNIFSKDFLIPAFYAKQDQQVANNKMIELGKTLFFDPVLSSNNERACASCHSPEKAFTDGLEKSMAFDFKGNLVRNSPTLLNAVFTKSYFWDGRVEYLQDQVPDVVLNKVEFHNTFKNIVEKLNTSAAYMQLFKNAFKRARW